MNKQKVCFNTLLALLKRRIGEGHTHMSTNVNKTEYEWHKLHSINKTIFVCFFLVFHRSRFYQLKQKKDIS